MRNRDLARQLQEQQSMVDASSDFDNNPARAHHWRRYLCVAAVGFLERGLQTLYTEYALRSSDPRVAHFVENRLRYVRNPNTETILQTAARFDPEWREELQSYFRRNQSLARSINSVARLRNAIAHGREARVSHLRVSEYLGMAVEILELIERQCTRDAAPPAAAQPSRE